MIFLFFGSSLAHLEPELELFEVWEFGSWCHWRWWWSVARLSPIYVLFAFKIFLLPVPTRPGTRTFLQVPDSSRPEVKNPYPSGLLADLSITTYILVAAMIPNENCRTLKKYCFFGGWTSLNRCGEKCIAPSGLKNHPFLRWLKFQTLKTYFVRSSSIFLWKHE